MTASAREDRATLPLSGIRVLDFSRVLAGPYATMILADLGAEIIKVEQPGVGDITRENAPLINGESHYFLSINRNKKSVELDLRSEEGQEVARELVGKCDVVLENFRPGVMKRFGLDYDRLKEINPRLVMCSISGFGQARQTERPAFDIVLQALTGLMSVNGEPDGPPTRLGIPIGDLAAGLFACIGITSALREREVLGVGRQVDVSMYRCMVTMLGYMAGYYFATGRSPRRVGSNHHSIGPMGPFAASDGEIVLAIFTGKFWRLYCDAIGHPELRKDPRFAKTNDRVANMAELRPLLDEYMRTRTVAEWERVLTEAGVPCARINEVGQVLDDPFTQEIGLVQTVRHPTIGDLPVIGPALVLPESPAAPLFPPPLLGQHTEEVLADLLGRHVTGEAVSGNRNGTGNGNRHVPVTDAADVADELAEVPVADRAESGTGD